MILAGTSSYSYKSTFFERLLEKTERLLKSAVRKKMAAVHFTTIPFEPNTANYT